MNKLTEHEQRAFRRLGEAYFESVMTVLNAKNMLVSEEGKKIWNKAVRLQDEIAEFHDLLGHHTSWDGNE